MTALADACHDLAQALPRAQALTHLPDTTTRTARTAPASRPPWNQQAATALLDALEGARQLEQAWRSHAAGHPVPRRPMRMTGTVLTSLLRLAYGLPPCPPPEKDEKTGRPKPCRCERCEGVRNLVRWTTAILQLPAVDTEERPQQVGACCPYCGFHMLRLYARAGRVTCLRFGACYDSDGLHPVGHADRNRITGDGEVVWHDGLVT